MAGLSQADTERLAKSLEKQGAKVHFRNGQHLVQFPDGTGMTLRGTNSDTKSVNSQRSVVKRAGFVWPFDDKRAAKQAEKDGVLQVSGQIIEQGYPRYLTTARPNLGLIDRVNRAAAQLQERGEPITQSGIGRVLGISDPGKINQALYHGGWRWTDTVVNAGNGRTSARAWAKVGQPIAPPKGEAPERSTLGVLQEAMLRREAEASIAIDKGDVQTITIPEPPDEPNEVVAEVVERIAEEQPAVAELQDEREEGDAQEWEKIAREQEERAVEAERQHEDAVRQVREARAEVSRLTQSLRDERDRGNRIQAKFDADKAQWLKHEQELNRSLEGLRIQRDNAFKAVEEQRHEQPTAAPSATADDSWVINPQDGKPWTDIIAEAENYGLTVEVRARRR